jgi:anaerobic selenocysteine-containing dehydrogenase
MNAPAAERTSYRTCPLCEATCGLEIRTRGREVVSIRGDEEDVFSAGFLCPKAAALKELDQDPDRLRTPLVRRNGRHEPATWAEAFAEIDRRLREVVAKHGRDAVAAYAGNPSAHLLGLGLYNPTFLRALGTRNLFTASTVDQRPKELAGGLVFGTAVSYGVPDLDRARHLLILGANPMVSNGSLMTAPDVPAKLRAIRERGGRIVVVDPKRTRTAEVADEHVFIRPGSDALLLAAMLETLFAEGLAKPGRLAEHLNGLDDLRAFARRFTPERVAGRTGIDAATIRRLARELAATEPSCVYGRIGTTVQEFGTLASWLVDAVNVVTGNLDRPGGAMFPKPATGSPNTRGTPGRGKGIQIGRRRSRVRGAPETFGELPAACLAEEIETPGEGQIRALFTISGNPVLSTPGGARLANALESLELMVSVDIYLNETTRHADVVLPGLSTFEQSHYDLFLRQFAVRNVATYSPATFAVPEGQEPEWRTLLRLTAIASGQGPEADVDALDDAVAGGLAEQIARGGGSVVSPEAMLAAVAPRRGPERLLDLMLRGGPYGDRFDASREGLSLAVLEAHPHGVDLGPLEPRIPDVLRTPSGKIELAPPELLADGARLAAALEREDEPILLVGRRDLRSNNSWMHNLRVLVKGNDRCTLQVSPADAARLGLVDGGRARVSSTDGRIEVAVEVTERIMPGVVSLPHGWGHDDPGARLAIAAAHAGVNSNLLASTERLDPLSGTAILNGVPVTIEAAA